MYIETAMARGIFSLFILVGLLCIAFVLREFTPPWGVGKELEKQEKKISELEGGVADNRKTADSNRSAIEANRSAIEKNRVAIDGNRRTLGEHDKKLESTRQVLEKVEKELQRLAVQEQRLLDAYREEIITLDELRGQKAKINALRKEAEARINNVQVQQKQEVTLL